MVFNGTVNWLHIREAVQFFNGAVNWLHIREGVQFLTAQLIGDTSERECSF